MKHVRDFLLIISMFALVFVVSSVNSFTDGVMSSIQVRNTSKVTVLTIWENGNVSIMGRCSYGGLCNVPTVPYFGIRNSSGSLNFWVNNSGDLCMTGDPTVGTISVLNCGIFSLYTRTSFINSTGYENSCIYDIKGKMHLQSVAGAYQACKGRWTPI